MIALISDIHGNYPALQSVLHDIDSKGIETIICLGDTAGYYSQINECCDLLQQRKIYSLMGNHDWYIAMEQPCPRSQSANDCLQYQRGVITRSNMDWLRSLVPAAQKEGISMVHGGWNNPLDEYLLPTREYFDNLKGETFASGHTHVPIVWTGGGKRYCNPGSVGQPRDGDPRASYAIFNQEGFKIIRVSYDIELTQRSMKKAGFSDYYYTNLLNGSRIGGKIDPVPAIKSE